MNDTIYREPVGEPVRPRPMSPIFSHLQDPKFEWAFGCLSTWGMLGPSRQGRVRGGYSARNTAPSGRAFDVSPGQRASGRESMTRGHRGRDQVLVMMITLAVGTESRAGVSFGIYRQRWKKEVIRPGNYNQRFPWRGWASRYGQEWSGWRIDEPSHARVTFYRRRV